jgi:AAA+ ATPase superfamily predicted ATPase
MNQAQEDNQIDLEELKLKSTQFHDALFENPIDENILIDVLTSTTNEERQYIRGLYKQSYNNPIQNDIKSQLKDRLRQMAIDLFDTPYEYDARELHTALNSLTNDDNVIIEIFASRPSDYLEIVDTAYNNFFKISLKDEIKKHTSEEFAEYLIALMEVERPMEQTISGNDAYEYAEELKNGELANIGTDVEKFKTVFVEKSREDLILISRAYYEKTQKNLYEAIEAEVPGKNRRLIKAILFAVITPAQWFARKISKVVQESGDYNTIRRVLISRSEIDMYAIRDYYYMETNNELRTDILDENEDAYGQILTNLSLK